MHLKYNVYDYLAVIILRNKSRSKNNLKKTLTLNTDNCNIIY